jgi:uncharacterized phage protein (TIGR01671 family)
VREIKFRVWSNELNKMVYPDQRGWYQNCFIGDNQYIQTCSLGVVIDKNGKQLQVMQYTGLKDKNGKEIYEGDIVSTDLSRPFLIVEFRNGAFMYQCHHNGQDYYDHIEPAFSDAIESTKYHGVIGNIYENPDLLEGVADE